MQFQATIIKSFKNYFSTSGVVKTGFDAFPDHQIQVLKKLFINVWNGQKRVCMHLRILPDHQNQVWSGRKRFLMHFQATKIKSFKKLFFNVWSG
jgi:hypothetical protein